MASVVITDETTGGAEATRFELELPRERMTVRELIRERVYQEVKDHNVKARAGEATRFRGLIEPSEEEARLNGPKARRVREIDFEKQFEVATEAFERSGFLVIVGEKQVTGLDDEVELTSGTEVSFVRLTPLVGG